MTTKKKARKAKPKARVNARKAFEDANAALHAGVDQFADALGLPPWRVAALVGEGLLVLSDAKRLQEKVQGLAPDLKQRIGELLLPVLVGLQEKRASN